MDFALCEEEADGTTKRVARLNVNEQTATTISAQRHLLTFVPRYLSLGILQLAVNSAAVDYTISNLTAHKARQ
jgi:hypothetical protein